MNLEPGITFWISGTLTGVVLLLNLAGCEEDSAEMKVDSIAQAQIGEEQVPVFVQEEEGPPCGDLQLTGSPVLPEEVTGALRSATGGAIEDGIYRVVAHRVFGELPDHDNVPFHQTARFLDGASTLLLVHEAAGKERVMKYEARASSETIELTASCPKSIAGAKSKVAYSSEGDRLTFQIDRTDGIRTEVVYERVAEEVQGTEQ